MDTLPRFRLPDESSRDVNKVATASKWADFDDLDTLETRVKVRADEFECAPTKVRPALRAANVDDVVEDLRAAAAGRSSKVRELREGDLLEEVPNADEAQQVDVSELVFDRVVQRRDVWNVRQAANETKPTIHGPTKIPVRFLATAALAMTLGALFAVAAALLVWHFSNLSLAK